MLEFDHLHGCYLLHSNHPRHQGAIYIGYTGNNFNLTNHWVALNSFLACWLKFKREKLIRHNEFGNTIME